MLELNFLGVGEVLLDGQPVAFGRRGSIGLLAYLARTGKPHPREFLATLFAGDCTDTQARKHLSNMLIDLRWQLGDYVVASRQTVFFARDKPSQSDVAAFEGHVTSCLESQSIDDIERALAVYRDEFLSGFALSGAPDFEAWLTSEREDLRSKYVQALHARINQAIDSGHLSKGISAARRLLREEPWLEDVHRKLMLMLARSGQRRAALEQYEACMRALRLELAIKPQPETTALFNRLRGALTAPPHNLPSAVHDLFGRAKERQLLVELMCDTSCRLVTISGTAGAGKSRLAIDVGRAFTTCGPHLAEQPFPDGISLVDLAEVTPTVDSVFAAIGVALGLPESGAAVDDVLAFLRSRQMLLILDGLEHPIVGAEVLARLTDHAPHIKLLVTSRAPLRALGEHVLPLDGLPLPAHADELESAPSSALFLAEAQRVDIGFELPPAERPAVLELCHAVDGLPLAVMRAARAVARDATPRRAAVFNGVGEHILSMPSTATKSAATSADARVAERLAAIDWPTRFAELADRGWTTISRVLDADQCRAIAGWYDDDTRFRSHILMARHGFGRGEYKYFSYPLPSVISTLRTALYECLAPLANTWNESMRLPMRYPPAHADFIASCHAAGQARPTPLLLRYVEGDYNCLHQDVYGEHVFPMQVTFLLAEPHNDFTGGEFVLVEQRPRMQSRAMVVPLNQGDAVIFAVNQRPVQGARGAYRVTLRHAVSELRSGERHTLGIIFHDAT